MPTPDNSDLMNQLIQWAQQGGTQAPNNVPQSSSPQNSANSAISIAGGQQGNGGNFNGGNQQMPNILPQQQQQQQAPVLNLDQQKGVQQAVKAKQKADQQQGLQWGTQAIQSGANPQDLLSHPIMTGGNPSMPSGQTSAPANPQQILSSILPQGNNQQPSMQQQIQSANDKTALNVATQNEKESEPKDFFGRWQQQFQKMSGGMTQADRLSNLGAMQKLAGAEPLQKKDVSEMTANTYRAAIDGASKLVDADSDKFKNLTDMYGKLNDTKGLPNKALALPSDEQKQVMDSLRQTSQRLNTHLKNMGMLLDNRPSFNTQGVNANQENIKNKITGKTQSGISYSVVK